MLLGVNAEIFYELKRKTHTWWTWNWSEYTVCQLLWGGNDV